MKHVVQFLTAMLWLVSLTQAQYVQLSPTGAQTITQPSNSAPLSINYLNPEFVNGVAQASQFTGTDPCIKLQNANLYAIENHIGIVDATGFQGIVATCTVNPFALSAAVSSGTVTQLLVKFGTVHFKSSVQWHIVNSGISIQSPGPMQFQLEYTGPQITTGTSAALFVDGTTSAYGYNGMIVHIDGMFVYGDTLAGNVPNVTDAVVVQDTNRSDFRNLSAWGASGCGIHSEGNVTSTWYRPHVSNVEFTILTNIATSGSPQPANGLCFDSSSHTGYQTKDSTVTDPVAEGVSNIGWYVMSAQGLTVTSGTSEGNLKGLVVSSGSFNKFNTFIDPDIEGNGSPTVNTSGVDINDQGQSNTYVNPITASACSSCNSVTAGGGGGQYILGELGMTTSYNGSFNVLGANSNLGKDGVTTISGIFSAPILSSNGGAPTITRGTNVTSAGCTLYHTCTDSRGSIAIVGGSATTGVIATVTYAGTYSRAPECIVIEGSEVSFPYNLTWSSPSTTGFNITAGNSVAGQTVYVQYSCTD